MKKFIQFMLFTGVFLLFFQQSQAQCKANFMYYAQGTTVSFVDSSWSNGTITGYWWNFGDGTSASSTKGYTSHKYSSPGTYYVCYAIYNSSCADTICDSVVVPGNGNQYRCQASFQLKSNGLQVLFNNTSTTSTGGAPAKILWKFGDGTSSDKWNPTHTYSKYGTYTICLKITDSVTNCKDSICQTITLSSPKCDAHFKWADSGNYIHFYGPVSLSTGKPYLKYKWIFGDGDTGTTQNPVHHYKTKKPYRVCLYVWDNGCAADYCDSIWKSNSGGGQGNCKASFSWKNVSGNWVEFINTSSTVNQQGVFYTWSFGNGKTSQIMNPKIDFGAPGIYKVCLVLYDSIHKCSATYCDSVVIHNVCKSYFSFQQNGKTVYFANTSSSNNTVAYHWTFGDGNSSTVKNPTHTYSSNGTYQVCLKISSSSGCLDSFCKTVYIGSKHVLEGNVYYGKTQNTIKYGKVWIIKYDSAAGTLTGVDSGETKTNGSFRFELPPGYYLVKAALTKYDSLYKRFLPTYHTSYLNWDSATLVTLNANKYIKISLRPGKNKGGKGFIAGKTSQGANKTTAMGDPVEGVQIHLLDADFDAVDFTYSDANGAWFFSDLDEGSYHVVAEELGKKSYALPIQIAGIQTQVNNVVIEINSLTTTATFNLGGAYIFPEEAVVIFPNPASSMLHIQAPKGQCQIFALNGQKLKDFRLNESNVDISDLNSGIYMFILHTDKGQILQHKFVKE